MILLRVSGTIPEYNLNSDSFSNALDNMIESFVNVPLSVGALLGAMPDFIKTCLGIIMVLALIGIFLKVLFH